MNTIVATRKPDCRDAGRSNKKQPASPNSLIEDESETVVN
jgi:hypothetical protein